MPTNKKNWCSIPFNETNTFLEQTYIRNRHVNIELCIVTDVFGSVPLYYVRIHIYI